MRVSAMPFFSYRIPENNEKVIPDEPDLCFNGWLIRIRGVVWFAAELESVVED
ncbi:MAG: hypothetical protein HY914_12100 [Desulfomonile tiedjei]|nr:hypothetical protein [Desulfomonile tiedjei]